MNSAVMIVPNTKEGLDTIKYLSKQIVGNDILIKLVSKKEFAQVIKNTKGDLK
jgi:hypothetical protein